MNGSHWLRELRTAFRPAGKCGRQNRQRRSSGHTRRARVELLEERTLLATLTVNSPLDNNTPGDGLVTLREAIIAANTNTATDLGHTGFGADTIQFAPAAFATPQTALLAFGELLITESLTINGPGRDLLTIDAQQNSRIFNITATSGDFAIAGLTLTGGNSTGGGGAIRSSGNLTVDQSTVTANRAAGNGGGIYGQSNLWLTNCTIAGNSTVGPDREGGGIFAGGLAVIECVISGNSVTGSGGGFTASRGVIQSEMSEVNLSKSIVSGNSATGSGGGFSVKNSLRVNDSEIRDNTSGDKGGGFAFLASIFLQNRVKATVVDSTISGNSATGSGGGFHGAPFVDVSRSQISSNTSGDKGGGFFATAAVESFNYLNGNVSLVDTTISANDAISGGGFWSDFKSTLFRCTVTANKGGGIFSQFGSTIESSAISDNISDTSGGGIISTGGLQGSPGVLYSGYVELISSSVTGNTSNASGGGVYVAGTAVLSDSTVSGNHAMKSGGGVFVKTLFASTRFGYFVAGTATLNTSTVSNNESQEKGGGINARWVAANSSTVSGNRAVTGGGIYSRNDAKIRSTTITANIATNGAGGGIWNSDEPITAFPYDDPTMVTIEQSIVAANTASAGSPDLGPNGAPLIVTASLIGNNAGTGLVESHTPDANGNLIGSTAGGGVINPQLAPLADNGGPTKTHALLASSPAVDRISYYPPGPVPAHDYLLNNSLTDLAGGPPLVALGGTLSTTGYEFAPNQGLNLASALANPANYTLEIQFRWNALSGGWQKIVDFHNLTSNVGLYTASNGLHFRDGPFVANLFDPNTLYRLVLTRDSTTNIVRAYLHGAEVWNFTDAAGDAIFDGPNQVIRFFQDDSVTGQAETQAGFVDQIRIYNSVLTPAQVAALTNPPALPAYDQRGTPFARVRDGNGDGVPQVDMGAYELQSAANMPPVFTSPDAASVPENTTTVLTVTATDDLTPPQAITYAIVGGVDQARFSITTGGALTFKSPPDFEAPADANGDNVYLVIVEASDGGLTSLQAVVVTVTAVNDASPVFTSPSAVSVVEGTTAVTTLAATDADLPPQTVTFAIVGGADQLKFTVTAGMLRFITPPDFAAPGDADGNNVYEVVVRADDGQGRTTLQTILVTVTSPPADYGDAPDAAAGTAAGNYQTRAADNGPRHTIVPGLRLGASIDADSGTLQNAMANADDVDSALPDDEDGVSNPAADLALTIGAQPTVNLRATNTTGSSATLYGWIDYNANGVFENATERASVAVPAGTNNGIVTLVFPTVPPGFHGTTYARFRLSTDVAAASPTGVAVDGEVEDYRATIVMPSGTADSSKTKVVSGFELSVASLGDLDGDGVTDLAVGSERSNWVSILLMNTDGTQKSSRTIFSDMVGGPPPADSSNFGSAVAAIGDLNGDGITDLVVGSDSDRSVGPHHGAIYVLFLNPDGTVKSSQKIGDGVGGGPILRDQSYFGASATSLGDMDGDGVTDIAIGARGASESYVLFLNANGTVKASHPFAGGGLEQFGRSMASLGDLDGDGISELAVGASRDDSEGSNRGAVYIHFMNANGTVKSRQAIGSRVGGGPALSDGAGFGVAMSLSGDLDGDGVSDLFVGAYGVDRTGVVYLLLLNTNGTVKSLQKIGNAEGGGPPLSMYDQFGKTVASLGDLDGDGYTDVAVGSVQASGGSGYLRVLFLKASNASPAITSSPIAAVPENTSSVMTVTATDSDVPPQTVTFSLVGGADQGRFTIAQAGALSFQAAPDFDVPGDANGNNVYEVTVQASDGNGGFATQTIQVTVTPVNDNTPVFTSPDAVSVPENTTTPVLTVMATDADRPPQTITYALVGGSDQAKFNITPNGALSFKSPPDFEMPADANGDNLYILIVQASDGTRSDLQVVLVTVTNVVNEQLLAGDYNMSGTVDAADYVLWRRTLGTTVPPSSGADGSGNGVIDQADYAVWRANFGRTLPAASAAFIPPPVFDKERARSPAYRPSRRPTVPVADASNDLALATWPKLPLAATVDWLPDDEMDVWSPARRPRERGDAAATALDLAFAAL